MQSTTQVECVMAKLVQASPFPDHKWHSWQGAGGGGGGVWHGWSSPSPWTSSCTGRWHSRRVAAPEDHVMVPYCRKMERLDVGQKQ